MEQEAYWDSAARKKTFTIPLNLDLVKKFSAPASRLLDYGCGYGRTLLELKQAGYKKLAGMDFSAAMLERGMPSLEGITLTHVHNNEIPLEDASVDGVFLIALLTCIVQNDALYALIGEVRRVLAPGGFLYVGDFLLNTDERNLKRYKEAESGMGVYGAFILPEGSAVRHFDRGFIERLLGGFTQEAFYEEAYTTMNGNPSRGFTWLGTRKSPPPPPVSFIQIYIEADTYFFYFVFYKWCFFYHILQFIF
jgi:SAM-dependent methyltransferase